MSEGPSIIFLKNKLQRYKGKTVSKVSGDSTIDESLFENATLIDIQTFGKNFLFIFKEFFAAIEVNLVGNVLVNKRKKIAAGFSFHFEENEINFYNSDVKVFQGKPTDHFNFKTDISKPEFDADFILNELQSNHHDEKIGAALLNQNILAGVGPIIRTETLYHAKIHPDSLIKAIPEKKLIFLLKMVVDYAEEFLTLLKTDSVEKNALIFEKKNCPKDKFPLVIAEVGKVKTYVCEKCQKLFV
ncbi:hypothetical protein Q73A0000_15425 [Kaistella flava (ex Peng et al. 2021)]|uniref:Formamidopyrimidine-DNA glycosylase H2TH DNA-binding domain-containing protein n=1 Tax=Kaistella flava (ex Peng et al. 2021) TaxID=2038776 RepID=A0A7M2YDF7_9FLAO|nr:hypothetical protein [Kaistella flava (ex Peng et al. 2021)]QOW11664.1 hypothetical protein Q73A0000_15425 [Kaistella flava (ex Peng et al. 2021)]